MTLADRSFDQAYHSNHSANRNNDNAALHRLGKRPQLKVCKILDVVQHGLTDEAQLWVYVHGRVLHHSDGKWHKRCVRFVAI